MPLRFSTLALLLMTAPARGQLWSETQQLAQLDSGPAVAASGTTLVAGNTSNNASPGFAVVYESGPGGWQPAQQLVDPSGQLGTNYAESLDVDGDTIAVGAWTEDVGAVQLAGAVYAYRRAGGTWVLEQRIEDANPLQGVGFGERVALSGDTLAILSWTGVFNTNFEVQVFTRTGSVWSHQQTIATPTFENDFDLDGDTLVVGDVYAGRAHVYTRSSGVWTLEQSLQPSSVVPGAQFGTAVSLLGDEVVVAAPEEDHSGFSEAGAAYVFARSGQAWSETARLAASDARNNDHFATSVSIFGDQVAVGVPDDNHNALNNPGSVRVFVRTGSGWHESGLLVNASPASSVGLGRDVAQRSGLIVAGTYSDSAYLFAGGAAVTQFCTAGTSASGCQALISATGTPSASAPSGFVLAATGVEGEKQGLAFFGTSGPTALPWGNGTSVRCTANPVSRGGLLASGGTLGACDGSFSYDLNARWTQKPAQNPGAGARVQAQFWYRDPFNTSNQSTSLSDAVDCYVMP